MLLFIFPAQLRTAASLFTGRTAHWLSCWILSSRTLGSRGDIPFIAGKVVHKCKYPARDAIDRFDWNAVWRNATILRLPETVLRLSLVAAAAVSAVFALSSAVLV